MCVVCSKWFELQILHVKLQLLAQKYSFNLNLQNKMIILNLKKYIYVRLFVLNLHLCI